MEETLELEREQQEEDDEQEENNLLCEYFLSGNQEYLFKVQPKTNYASAVHLSSQ